MRFKVLIVFSFVLALALPDLLNAAQITGQLESTTDDYPYTLGPPTQTLIPYLSLSLNSKYRLSKAWHAQWKLYGLSNLSTHEAPETLYGDIPEGFFEYKSGPVKVRIGMNTVNWGVVDVSSPSDNVNTVVLFQPLRTFKQGAPMVNATFGREALNLDLLYIPVQRPTQLPAADSRWLPRQFLVNLPTYGTVNLPSTLQYDYIHSQTLDHALNNNYGAKLASHLGSFDLQVTHYEGVSVSPTIQPTVKVDTFPVLQAESPIYLSPISYRVRTTGFGFVWAREKWIYRGETSYQHTISVNPLVQPWIWSSVLGAETNLQIRASTVTLLTQIYYSKNPQGADNLISSSYRLFDQTALLGARIAYSDDITVTLSGLYEAPTEGLFWMAGFDQKLGDHLKWGLGWRNFSAPKQGLIQTFATNNHASLDLTYFF